MKNTLRQLWPAWASCILLPLPAIIFWRSDYGRGVAVGLFFVGCSILVSSAFRQEFIQKIAAGTERPDRIWRSRMKMLSVTLLAAFGIFSFLLLALSDARDFVAVALAFFLLIPSLGAVPYFTLLTSQRLAAVVFTLCAVLCMKLIGCVVIVLVYGWHADAHNPPYTDMPWTQPNLLVWLFWLNTCVLSAWLYSLSRKRFIREIAIPPNQLQESTAVYDCRSV